jgi:hypothetical protein
MKSKRENNGFNYFLRACPGLKRKRKIVINGKVMILIIK